MYIHGLMTIGIGYLVSYILIPVISTMLLNAGFVRPNYRGEQIPLGVGLVFGLSFLVTGSLWLLLQPAYSATTLLCMFAAFSMMLLGLIDDVFGSRDATGLKGHFKKLLFEKELTTGALKALAGGMVAMAVSIYLFRVDSVMDILFLFLNALIIAFSTNAVNLLDLRPGRAIKGYLFVSLVLIFIGFRNVEIWLLAFLTGAVLAYLPYDLKALSMMGDTGSNVLGVFLGIIAVLVLPLIPKLIFFALLILFHLYTEKVSLTQTIENNRVLKYIDMIGREK